MKYSHLLLILISFSLFTSCIVDDTAPKPVAETNDIQGEWFITELNASQAVDLDSDGISNIDLTLETTCFNGIKVVFENDSYQFTYPDINVDESNDEFNCVNTLNTGTFTLENNILTATTTIDNSTVIENVSIELEANVFKFKASNEQINRYFTSETKYTEIKNLEYLQFVFEK